MHIFIIIINAYLSCAVLFLDVSGVLMIVCVVSMYLQCELSYVVCAYCCCFITNTLLKMKNELLATIKIKTHEKVQNPQNMYRSLCTVLAVLIGEA